MGARPYVSFGDAAWNACKVWCSHIEDTASGASPCESAEDVVGVGGEAQLPSLHK